MKNPRARTKLACRIARLNPDRFNEAVHSGAFPCAPRERDGTSRVFDVNDIITLRVYSHLTDEGMIAKKAGPMACELRALLSERPDAERVVCIKHSFGSSVWIDAEHFDPADDFAPGMGNGRPDVVSVREWRLKFLRERIVAEIEDDGEIRGEG